jgi:amino acid adenylation domain-containing protein/non-ribosomal peptide synthase protein (TIGR01720 family)
MEWSLMYRSAASWVEWVRERSVERPNQAAYTFLADGEEESLTLTYGELDRRARALGAWIQEQGFAGERVLLLYSPGLEFITAFLGCLYGGAVAVPAYPPGSSRSLPRLQILARDAQPALVLTTSTLEPRLRSAAGKIAELSAIPRLATDEIPDGLAGAWRAPVLDESSLAFLQYTSGSTASPKGVMVSHGNLLRNEEMIRRAFDQSADSVVVSWLPLYHDMGLIGGVFQPLYTGARCILMAPAVFLHRPARWLEAISHYRATTSGGPDFAYELCIRKVPEAARRGLDLSSWRVAFNGAEPVRAETLRRFAQAFAPCGFDSRAFFPCYGLAEATLFVAGGAVGREPVVTRVSQEALARDRMAPAGEEPVRELVGCGQSTDGVEVVVADPETGRRSAPDRVGEIWVAGPGVARGYWGQPELSGQVFAARLADEPEAGPFLRTGDLGFLRDGELYVTGRLKDLVILRGRNLYPQDLELSAERSHPTLSPGSTGAFSVEQDGEERLVIVCELDRRSQELATEVAAAVRSAVAEDHEVGVHAVVLLRTGGIPRTSSGKIRRHACRAGYLAGSLDALELSVLTADAPPEAGPLPDRADLAQLAPEERREHLTQALARRVAARLRIDPGRMDRRQPLTSFGLDSLSAAELANDLEEMFGVSLGPADLLGGARLDDLAGALVADPAVREQDMEAPRAGEASSVYPLSQGQRALWFLERLAPTGGAYNIAVPTRIVGPLDVEALRRSLQALVDRHPALRTTFEEGDGEPIQQVHDRVEVDFQVQEAHSLSTAEVDARVAEEAYRPFDLEGGSLLRVRLFTRDGDPLLLLVIHHLVTDFWSLSILAAELGRIYAAETRKQEVRLAPLGPGYGDFVLWQRRWLASPAGERSWENWQRALGKDLPELALPTDRPRSPVPTHDGASRSIRLGGDLAARVRALGCRREATLYTTLLASFFALLHRLTGQDDLILGSPTAGRGAAGLAPLVGYFVNPVPLRVRLGGDPSFEDLLAAVRDTVLAALAHQHYPFPLLVDRLQPERDSSRTPLFQVVFVLQRSPAPGAGNLGAFALQEPGFRLRLGDLELESHKLARRRVPFDLTLVAAEIGDDLGMAAEFDHSLFDGTTIERMCGHLSTLLAAAVAAPELRVSELPLLTAVERAQMLEWNATSADCPTDLCLHELVERQVDRTPDRVALSFEGEVLTYAGLDAAANHLALRLRALGVGPEVPVGLLAERSPEMVIALLAAIKAGGAYLPLDPDYPADRLGFLLADSGALVVLGQERLLPRLPEHPAQVVLLDGATAARAGRLAGGAGSLSIAYILYTSGSTGRPKGTMNSHRGVVNQLLWMQQLYTADDRVLQKTPLSFDPSIWEIFVPLLAGARLVLASPEGHRDSACLVATVEREGVTILGLVPSQLAAFLAERGVTAGCRSLRLLFCGGEVLPPELQRQSFALLPEVDLHNLYGPTEAAVYVTHWACERAERCGVVPIGRPLTNTRVHLLDALGHPMPVGTPGELHIGGAQVCRGYLGSPELTAERFVPDPFAAEPGARLYRTGDLARYLPDGAIDFLGRIDDQVKVRGLRIELGEIESVLRAHRQVREALVLAPEAAPGHKRLVAWVAAEETDAEDLRGFARTKLPEYMVPAVFVFLPALPLTASGKVDRRGEAPGGGHVPPRGAVEEALAEIWCEVLGLDRVGARDNFFHLGGDSILSLQVVSRASRRGLRLTPRQVFQYQTLAELAAVAALAVGGRTGRTPVSGPVPLTPIQRWFFARELPDPHHFNQAVLLAASGPLDAGRIERALGSLAGHHDALRLRFTRDGDGWLQEAAPPGAGIPCPQVDLAVLPAAVRPLALEASAAALQAGFDLSAGGLFRAALFTGWKDGARLFLVAHHLVVDAVSWRILVQDLEEVYGQLEQGEEILLPAPATSYQEWATGLAALAAGGAFRAEEELWRSQSGEVSPLPSDGGGEAPASCALTLALTSTETEALLRNVPAAYRTRVDEALLAALAQSIRRWTGDFRILIELEGHGREEELIAGADLSRTVGWFTSLYPVLLDLAGAEGPGAALKAIKEQLRRVPHRGLGYGVLRHLADAPELARLPRPEISFNYLGRLDAGRGGSRFTLVGEPTGSTRSPRNPQAHPIEIDGGIDGGRLELTWSWDRSRFLDATIERLAAGFLAELRGLIAHCCSPEAGGLTPSDFPLARLDERTLDAVAGGAGDIEDIYPLSPAQHGILFHALLEPGSGIYFEQMACTFEGELDAPVFERAWRQVVARHPVLRTAFAWQGLAEPLQIVRSRVEPTWRCEDWRGLAPDEQRLRVEELQRRDRAEGFDLTRAPLLRFLLVRQANDVHTFVWSHHHLILDGWSWPLVLKDVFAAYAALRAGRTPSLPQVRPFRDAIAWLAGRDLAPAEAYWRRALEGLRGPTHLAVDRSTQPCPGWEDEPGERVLRLDAAAVDGLRTLARRRGLTLSTLVQGAWSLVLGLYSGEADVVFGAAVSGRPADLAEAESMVGMFINTLPVRVRLDGGAEVLPWLDELQAQQAEQREHEQSPLVRVREWSGLPADLPLFETLVVFENYPLDASLAALPGGLRVTASRFVERTSYPLTLTALPHGRLALDLRWDRSRFADVDAARMLSHLAAFLDAFVSRPAGRPAELPWMSEAERHQLLVEWNQAPGGLYPGDTTLHGLFEEQAARTPEAPAVVFAGSTLSYAELDRRADRLAHRLRELGVWPGDLVGIAAERSPEMMVGLFGILKAGGAYVPIDPSYPADRLAQMLEDSWVRVLATQRHLLDRLPSHWARVLLLDGPLPETAGRCRGGAGADDLAYAIYTSGSTGRPKAAMNAHRGVVNRLLWMQEAYNLTSRDRVLQKTPISFDVSVWELFWPLATGACLALAAPGAHGDPAYLVEAIVRAGITTLHFVPSMLQAFVEAPGIERCAAVERVITSGEALPADLAQRLLERLPGAALHNLYGPTEAAVDVTAWPCERDGDRTSVPIGRPVANTSIFLLDAAFRPVPPGVAGELYIGGIQVGRGYLGRPELTAERFVPDPFATAPGARLYRTGDLARHTGDGAVEYLGRTDFQVKLRGFRIELGEIEAALTALPAVREAVVTAREDRPGDRRLVACVVLRREDASGAAELRGLLAASLPEHMVPSAFVILDAMPLSPSGKVERRALPAPAVEAGPTEAAAPRSPVEELLAGIWCEVLDIERAGSGDSFFHLGGHSLLATRLVSRVREAFGWSCRCAACSRRPRWPPRRARSKPCARTLTAPPSCRRCGGVRAASARLSPSRSSGSGSSTGWSPADRSTTSVRRPASPVRWMSRRWRGASPRSCGGTRRCGRSSPRTRRVSSR